ncbi:hypothetical protein ZIOFF_012463 [Zingiber officinale]|uniref:DDE Tnp4 domain-containing protein n=1 Tax=Zingiber officinale TaxID=94328 RepID=A0A8J5LQR7_ZINOF|nr:hypothetical protein ZIOFF_012463 [Zingiber officinale]
MQSCGSRHRCEQPLRQAESRPQETPAANRKKPLWPVASRRLKRLAASRTLRGPRVGARGQPRSSPRGQPQASPRGWLRLGSEQAPQALCSGRPLTAGMPQTSTCGGWPAAADLQQPACGGNTHFDHCVGALDGTHIRVKVSDEDARIYRGRKDWPTTNVLAAYSFDLKFTYILSGWEGTTSDSRIVKNALSRHDKLLIPHGKYYLVDSGFMLKRGLITPYRGIRYHLKEYSRCGPTNAKELFNLRHTSLRNAIERAFGVLKKRFPIIASGT